MFGDMLAIESRYVDALVSGDPASVFVPRAGLVMDVDDHPYDMVREGVARVDIMGPLLQVGGWFYDGHESIRGKMEAAIADPAVDVVVMNLRSPGGMVAGMMDAARAVQKAAKIAGKRTFAFANEYAYSAGMWWASIADGGIYLPQTGSIGSVGALTYLVSLSRALDKAGVDIEIIRSGKRKAAGDPYGPVQDETRKEYQTTIDYIGGLFVEETARNRKLDVDAVWAQEARIYHGPDAVTAGLADGIMSFDAFLAMVEDAANKRRKKMQKVYGALGLNTAEAQTEQAAVAAIEAMRDSAHKYRVEAIDAHLEAAMTSGKITAAKRDQYREIGIAMGADGPSRVVALLRTETAKALPEPVHVANGAPVHRSDDAKTEMKPPQTTLEQYRAMPPEARAHLAESNRAEFDRLRNLDRAGKKDTHALMPARA